LTYRTIEGKNRAAVMRKVVGASIALGAMVAAAASLPGIEKARLDGVAAGIEKATAATDRRVAGALEAYLAAVAERTQIAGSVPQLASQLELLRDESIEGPLGATLRDFFNAEKVWARWRAEFPLAGISTEGTRVGLLVGAPAASLTAGPLLEKARAGTPAADIVLAGPEPHAVGVAPVTVRGRSAPVVLLLGRPVDDAVVADLGKRAGLALVLSDGHRLRARHGAAADVERLARAVGSESSGDIFAGDGGTWAAARHALAPGFWLLALSDSAERTAAANGTARTTRIIVWSAGALIALLGLFFGFRRSGPVAAPVVTRVAPVRTPSRSPIIQESTPTPLVTQLPDLTGPGSAGLNAAVTKIGAPPPAANPLRSFGRYVLLSQLGEGGMAKVYTAVVFGAEGFRRKFVIKRLRPELIEDASVVAQFIDEANMAASLVHSNIVPVLDFGKVDDEYFLATEYILGRDLGRVTQRCLEVERSGMPPDTVLYVAQEVLKALEYAHGKASESGRPLGLVHRDVSPSNVLVSARGEVKLFDFGIVKGEGRVTRTEHGVVKGNVSFMSPEQARGTGVDARADLFSLGLVLYTCLTGQVLYQGNTTYELLVKAATGPGPDEIARLRALPSPMGALLEKALAPDPNGRFQDAAEFAAAVAPLVGRGGAELSALVLRLFADDFRQEEAAFASATPPPNAPAPAPAREKVARGGS
jgi:hypothetical protein